MQCVEIEALIQETLDRRLPWDREPALAEHFQACSACRRLANSMQQAVIGLGQLASPSAPPDLAARVLREIRLPADIEPARTAPLVPIHARARSWQWSASLWAVAASLLVMVAAPWNWFPDKSDVGPGVGPGVGGPAVAQGDRVTTDAVPPSADQDRPATDQDRPAADTASVASENDAARDVLREPMAPLPPITELARNAGEKYRSLAERTGESLAVVWPIVPVVSETADPADVAPAGGAPGVWLAGMTEGLKPVTRSTTGSLNSFMQLLSVPPAPPEGAKGERL